MSAVLARRPAGAGHDDADALLQRQHDAWEEYRLACVRCWDDPSEANHAAAGAAMTAFEAVFLDNGAAGA